VLIGGVVDVPGLGLEPGLAVGADERQGQPEQGLLAAERSESGQRRYGEKAADRVQLIQQLYAAGISSAAILEMLPCVVTGIASPQVLAKLRGHRSSVVKQIQDLQETLRKLDSVMAGASRSHESGMPCSAG
jgi:DNA-binding transcriptional MerR regulator